MKYWGVRSARCMLYGKLDREIARCPGAIEDREVLFRSLLLRYKTYGRVPEFRLVRESEEETYGKGRQPLRMDD